MRAKSRQTSLLLIPVLLLLLFQNCAPFRGNNFFAPSTEQESTNTGSENTPEDNTSAQDSPTTGQQTPPPAACGATRYYQKSIPGAYRIYCGSSYDALLSDIPLPDTGDAVVRLTYRLHHDGALNSVNAGLLRVTAGDGSLVTNRTTEYFTGVGYGALCPSATGSYQTFAYGKFNSSNPRIAISARAYGTGCAGGGNASALYVTEMQVEAWVEDAACTGAEKSIHAWSYQKESLRQGVDRPIYIQTSVTPIMQKSVTLTKPATVVALGQNYATRTPDATSAFGAIACGQQYHTAASVLTVAGAQSVHTDVFTASQGQTHVMLSNILSANAAAGTHAVNLGAAVNQSVSAGYTITGFNNSGDSAIAVIKGPFNGKTW